MKKMLLVVIMFLSGIVPVAIGAEDIAANAFLSKNYGWTIDFGKVARWFTWSKMLCDSTRVTSPSADTKRIFCWVCRQEDFSYWTVILWWLPDAGPEPVEKIVIRETYNDYVRLSPVECEEEAVALDAGVKGVMKKCIVKRTDAGLYYKHLSFLHFVADVPAESTAQSGKEMVSHKKLGFTIYVKNRDSTNIPSDVSEKLREIAKAIRFDQRP